VAVTLYPLWQLKHTDPSKQVWQNYIESLHLKQVLLTRKYKDVQYKQVTSSEHIRHPVKEVQDWHTLELFLKYPFAQEMH